MVGEFAQLCSATTWRGKGGGLESGVDEGERGACWVLSRNISTSQLKKDILFRALLHFCVMCIVRFSIRYFSAVRKVYLFTYYTTIFVVAFFFPCQGF